MSKWIVRRVLKGRTPAGDRIAVEAGLEHLDGNQRPYFSVTAEIIPRGRRNPDRCGCLHNEVLAVFPQLAPIVALHLADDDGCPMHAAANAAYFIREGQISTAETLLRLATLPPTTVAAARQAATANGPLDVARFVEELRPAWREQARQGIALLESLPEQS